MDIAVRLARAVVLVVPRRGEAISPRGNVVEAPSLVVMVSRGRRPPNLLGGGRPPPLGSPHGSRLLVPHVPGHRLFRNVAHRPHVVARTPKVAVAERGLQRRMFPEHHDPRRPLEHLDDTSGRLGRRRPDEQVNVVRHDLQLLDFPTSGLGDGTDTGLEPALDRPGEALSVLRAPHNVIRQFVDRRTRALDFHGGLISLEAYIPVDADRAGAS